MVGEDLTVCTSIWDDRKYLKLNVKLCNALNPNNKSKWIVIENDPSSTEFMEASPPILLVFKGFPMNYSQIRPSSYHHALALNKAIKFVKTRFVLLLDPDFYIVRKNWISDILENIKKNKLAFFGAPWNPKYSSKYRYFPNVNCMFIDLEQIDKNSLDFRPVTDDYTLRKDSLLITKIINRINNRYLNYFYRRRIIGASQDTGYHVYYRFANKKKIKTECVLPVFGELNNFKSRKGKIFYHIIPDRFSYIPKKRNYFTHLGFHEHGYMDVRAYGWEEYMWKNKPFSFHLRKFIKCTLEYEHNKDNLIEVLNKLTRIKITNVEI